MFYKMDLVKFSLNNALELGQSGKLILPSFVTIPVVSTRIKSAEFQTKKFWIEIEVGTDIFVIQKPELWDQRRLWIKILSTLDTNLRIFVISVRLNIVNW